MHSELHVWPNSVPGRVTGEVALGASVAVCAGVVAGGELSGRGLALPCLLLLLPPPSLVEVDVARQLRLAERPFARALWHLWQIFLEGGECLHEPQAT